MKILTKKYERYIVKLSPSYNSSPIPANIFSKIFQKRPNNFPYIFSFNEYELNEIKSILDKLITKNTNLLLDDCYSTILLSELFINIVRNNEEYFSSKQSELEEEIVEIQEYIDANYNKHITLEDLEKRYYISKFTISREFKLITGYNFKQYIILLRISKAKDLLVYSNKNINEISNEVGYDTDNVFIRMFKRYEMMTPTEFRKEFKYINDN